MALSNFAGARLVGLWKLVGLDLVKRPFLFDCAMVFTSAVDEAVASHLY
jgi:hypothetical protein